MIVGGVGSLARRSRDLKAFCCLTTISNGPATLGVVCAPSRPLSWQIGEVHFKPSLKMHCVDAVKRTEILLYAPACPIDGWQLT